MKFDEFVDSAKAQGNPPKGISLALEALWWVKRGDWGKAHDLAQKAKSPDGDWVHAYLHRIEGDLGNAAYWYDRAGKPVNTDSLSLEWEQMVNNFLDFG